MLLSCGSQPQQPFDAAGQSRRLRYPAAAAHAARIVEIIDADEARRRAGRNRFRHYREQGLTPETHNIAATNARHDSPLR